MKDFDIMEYLKTCGYETRCRINAINAAQDMLALLRREAHPMRAGEISNLLIKENVHGYEFWHNYADGTTDGYPYYTTARCVQQARKLAMMGLVAIEKVDCDPYTIEVESWSYDREQGWLKVMKPITVAKHTYYRAI